jgi:hypothetical protein
MIALIILSIGVLLAGWTFQAEADNLAVSAKVSAPLPGGPAVITSPGDGTRFSSVPITVAGTCPSDTYIKLYRNDVFSGTALCTTDGNFSLQIDLFPGANQLKARVFNLTDDEGPAPQVVTVYYDVPQQPTGGQSTPASNPSSGSSAPVAPLELKTDFGYKGYKVGQTITWSFDVSGGNPPYGINIDWGDGTNEVLSQRAAGRVSVGHRYKAAGNGYKGSFKIKISASDVDGRQTFLQLFLSVTPSGLPNFVASTLPSGPHISNSWLKVFWPAYAIVILMFFSFWLGEREEIISLKKRSFTRGRRA